MIEAFAHSISVLLRFYGDLKTLLYPNHNQGKLKRTLPEPTSVKDLIESCGVPHTEADLIIVNSKPVNFGHLIEGGERVSVYPFFHSFQNYSDDFLQPRELNQPRFLADVNLGKLARYLRLAGFDTSYSNNADDTSLIEQMLQEKRILITRDRKLLMHKVVTLGYLPRSDNAQIQLKEVLSRFDLFDKIKPYSRCINCNGLLRNVQKEEILDQLEPLTKKHYENFSKCGGCGQVYWAGSHRSRLPGSLKRLINIKKESESNDV